jgi:hypothetical protein
MHRRSMGPARRLALVAGVLLVAGSLLPWAESGGQAGELPQVFRGAFDGSGILSFLAGLATLALLALPYAMGDRPAPIDRGISFALLAIVALLGVAIWVPMVMLGDLSQFLPTRSYGFWLTTIGAVLLARSAFEIYLSRDGR